MIDLLTNNLDFLKSRNTDMFVRISDSYKIAVYVEDEEVAILALSDKMKRYYYGEKLKNSQWVLELMGREEGGTWEKLVPTAKERELLEFIIKELK